MNFRMRLDDFRAILNDPNFTKRLTLYGFPVFHSQLRLLFAQKKGQLVVFRCCVDGSLSESTAVMNNVDRFCVDAKNDRIYVVSGDQIMSLGLPRFERIREAGLTGNGLLRFLAFDALRSRIYIVKPGPDGGPFKGYQCSSETLQILSDTAENLTFDTDSWFLDQERDRLIAPW